MCGEEGSRVGEESGGEWSGEEGSGCRGGEWCGEEESGLSGGEGGRRVEGSRGK